jgi:hypothetical protein
MRFKEGDVVIFKSWDEMKQQYGINFSGREIHTFFPFVESMQYLCGKTIEFRGNTGIVNIKNVKITKCWFDAGLDLCRLRDYNMDCNWSISIDMVKLLFRSEDNGQS